MYAELVFYNGAKLLEAPFWDSKNNLLYFVAIRQNTIFSLNPDTGIIKSYETDGPVGCAVINMDGDILEAEKFGIFTINPITREKRLVSHINENSKMRYNDGTLDDKGRFLVDIMGDEERSAGKGGLYSLKNGIVKNLVYGTTVANGMGFSSKGDVLYFIDTPTKTVNAYDYNLETGEISNERVVVTLSDKGLPDGMCVDLDDMIWVAEWGGGKVCKWNTNTGEKICEIELPCNNVTSCCLGGKDLEYLYITTAKCSEYLESPVGGLFRMKIR